ncbi:YbdD/YjiX family protein [Streptomyces monticola]|uniref:YbdD/YjiX family protein n=1 Tax=Streptomyces monticola TaxID=2666263 RepID=A0ABW2JFU5_9ACTN
MGTPGSAHHPASPGAAHSSASPGTANSFWARARYWWRELTGEAVYDRYVAHARACAPGTEVMSRREFERERMDAREADPREGFRCC